MELLEFAEHADTRIGSRSGGQRKRVAVAMELLSDPHLLMLDEPTAGLDEGLDRVMMRLLRRVADAGRAVLLVTHSTANLALADAVLALDSAGRMAYCGDPAGMLPAFSAASHAETMQTLRSAAAEEPARPGTRTRRRGPARPTCVREPVEGRAAEPPVVGRLDLGTVHCSRVLIAREFRRMAATPLTMARALILLPLLTCALTAWADDRGLAGWPGAPNRMQGAALAALITSMAFFAMALSFSTIVGDRDVIEREHRWGVPPTAVVLAKAVTLLGPVILQASVTTTVYLSVRPAPDHVIRGWPVGVVIGGLLALLGIASMSLGLLISAASRSLERAVFLLMGTTAVLVVMTGLLVPLGAPKEMGGQTLAAVGQFTPTRWGTAAIAAYIGFVPVEVLDAGGKVATDRLWAQDVQHVLTAGASLLVLAVLFGLVAANLLVRQSRRRR